MTLNPNWASQTGGGVEGRHCPAPLSNGNPSCSGERLFALPTDYHHEQTKEQQWVRQAGACAPA